MRVVTSNNDARNPPVHDTIGLAWSGSVAAGASGAHASKTANYFVGEEHMSRSSPDLRGMCSSIPECEELVQHCLRHETEATTNLCIELEYRLAELHFNPFRGEDYLTSLVPLGTLSLTDPLWDSFYASELFADVRIMYSDLECFRTLARDPYYPDRKREEPLTPFFCAGGRRLGECVFERALLLRKIGVRSPQAKRLLLDLASMWRINGNALYAALSVARVMADVEAVANGKVDSNALTPYTSSTVFNSFFTPEYAELVHSLSQIFFAKECHADADLLMRDLIGKAMCFDDIFNSNQSVEDCRANASIKHKSSKAAMFDLNLYTFCHWLSVRNESEAALSCYLKLPSQMHPGGLVDIRKRAQHAMNERNSRQLNRLLLFLAPFGLLAYAGRIIFRRVRENARRKRTVRAIKRR
jgi:hypothetical protein